MNTVFLDICGCNLDDFTELGEQTSKICISQVLMDLPVYNRLTSNFQTTNKLWINIVLF